MESLFTINGKRSFPDYQDLNFLALDDPDTMLFVNR